MNKQQGQIFEGVLSIIINTLLFGLKFWVGMLTNSIALIVDAWHSFSGSLSSTFVLITLKLTNLKADKKHPYGYGRWEQISSFFIAFLLGSLAFIFIKSSIEKFGNKESAEFGLIGIIVIVISIILKEILARIAFYIGKKTDNALVEADGWSHRSDSFSSAIVLIGIIICRFVGGLWWMDSLLGLFCSVTILYIAYKIMRDSISKLLGERPSDEFREQLIIDINSVYGDDLHIHHLHMHNYVTIKELTLHIQLDKDMTIAESHKIILAIENMIYEKHHMITYIQVEPVETPDDPHKDKNGKNTSEEVIYW